MYARNPAVDRYQIPIDELGDLRMCDIPPLSHVEILGLPQPRDMTSQEVYALHSGTYPKDGSLEVYGGGTFQSDTDGLHRAIARLRRAFPDLDPQQDSFLRNPHIQAKKADDGYEINVFMNLKFTDKPQTLVRDAVAPFSDGFRRSEQPVVHAFICHASEDKPFARELAAAMKRFGADVWFDEWEIRVGDSIVQKISDALCNVSHLVVVLSRNSIEKPWVQKELSSALMLQLSKQHIRVLPLRLDDSPIPAILADVKYADARSGIEKAIEQLRHALSGNTTTEGQIA